MVLVVNFFEIFEINFCFIVAIFHLSNLLTANLEIFSEI